MIEIATAQLMTPSPAWGIGLSALWGLFLTGLSWYCIRTGQQITYVTLSDGRRMERRLPLTFRLLLPFVGLPEPLVRSPHYERSRKSISTRLVAGGFEGLLSANEFMGLRFMVPIVMGAIWVGLIFLLVASSQNTVLLKLRPSLCVLGVLYYCLQPELWLRQQIAQRHRSIRRALPFLLDILTLSVEAGMDFMTALQRHVEVARLDALSEELIRVVREIQVGKTRREALRDMSTRVNLVDLRMVVNALVQADELGVSIGSILRIQSDQTRQRRFERAERLAHEAPVKLLFPLLLFIFPAVFLVLLGPVVKQVFEQGF